MKYEINLILGVFNELRLHEVRTVSKWRNNYNDGDLIVYHNNKCKGFIYKYIFALFYILIVIIHTRYVYYYDVFSQNINDTSLILYSYKLEVNKN